MFWDLSRRLKGETLLLTKSKDENPGEIDFRLGVELCVTGKRELHFSFFDRNEKERRSGKKVGVKGKNVVYKVEFKSKNWRHAAHVAMVALELCLGARPWEHSPHSRLCDPERPLHSSPLSGLNTASHGHGQILNQFPVKMDLIHPKRIFKALEEHWTWEKSRHQDKKSGVLMLLPTQWRKAIPNLQRPSHKTRNVGRTWGSSNIWHLVLFSSECFPHENLQIISKPDLKKLNALFWNNFKCIVSCKNST